MKWKLDENFGSRTVHLFLSAGHDAETVLQEQLSGSSDEFLFETCIRAVLRMPRNPSLLLLETLVGDLLRFLESESIRGRLWIVEPGRVRVHDDTDPRFM